MESHSFSEYEGMFEGSTRRSGAAGGYDPQERTVFKTLSGDGGTAGAGEGQDRWYRQAGGGLSRSGSRAVQVA